ncbi:unnamed protein product [Caenorhabditis brenneri]
MPFQIPFSKSTISFFVFSIVLLGVAAPKINYEEIAYIRCIILGLTLAWTLYDEERSKKRNKGQTKESQLAILLVMGNMVYDLFEMWQNAQKTRYLIVTMTFMYTGGMIGTYWLAGRLQLEWYGRKRNLFRVIATCAVLYSIIGVVGGEFIWDSLSQFMVKVGNTTLAAQENTTQATIY